MTANLLKRLISNEVGVTKTAVVNKSNKTSLNYSYMLRLSTTKPDVLMKRLTTHPAELKTICQRVNEPPCRGSSPSSTLV